MVGMKTCRTCNQPKPESEFHKFKKSKDGLDSKCKTCKREYHARYYREKEGRKEQIRAAANRLLDENRVHLVEYLNNHPCVDCGEPDTIVLEFDHLRDKTHNISVLIKKAPWTRVLEEIEKCEVRCANCHRRRTAAQLGWWKGNLPM